MSSVILNFISRHFFPFFVAADFFFFIRMHYFTVIWETSLVQPATLLPTSFGGMAWSERLPSAVYCCPCTSKGRGAFRYVNPCLWIYSEGRWQHSWDLPAPGDAGSGWLEWPVRQAPTCPTPNLCAAFLVDTRDLFSNVGERAGSGWSNSHLSLLQRLRETTLLPSYV